MNQAQTDGDTPTMTELEERLMGDGADAQREAILQRLSAIEARLGRSIAAGLPRADFAGWQYALAAVVAARAVMNHLPPAPAGTPPSTIEGLFRRAL